MEQKQIKTALISVFNKEGLEPVIKTLNNLNVVIYSTGGTQRFIEHLGFDCIAVESLTTYPSILGGRVKTLHPAVFGGILGRRYESQDLIEMEQYNIPQIDLVIVDLYPFEETLRNTSDESQIIEKIDIGGPSMIRAAAKNFKDLTVVAHKNDYEILENILIEQQGCTSLNQRKEFASKAFHVVMNYDIAINNYFNTDIYNPLHCEHVLRYGENPHQQGVFYGELNECFDILHGRALSYNNLVDTDSAIQLINDFRIEEAVFAIIKHTNVCGIAQRSSVSDAWDAALAGDPESAFGGVLVCNQEIDELTAGKINSLFFEILIAPSFEAKALDILQSKKNRIILRLKNDFTPKKSMFRSILNGTLSQTMDEGNYLEWKEEGAVESTSSQKEDMVFGNVVCKHLKSNAIAIVKNKQLLGKGCGQTSRIDALRHAIEKAKSFGFDLHHATLASDAFFPFDDCVRMAHKEGINTIIQPGGSIRDKDTISYCKENNLVLAITGQRHFRH